MNHTVETNASLARRAAAGDADAFICLTDRCRPMVFALCLQWTRNPTDAEDLTQETLVRAYAGLGQMRDPERFGAWMARIAVNLCRNWRTRTRHDLLPLTSIEQGVDDGDMTRSIVLRDAIASLSPDLRQVIEWFYLDGLSQQEIAVQWNLPHSTVKGRLDAGRLRLRKEFRKMGLLPEEVLEEAIMEARVALTDADPAETKALRAALKAAGFVTTVVKPEELILSRLRRFRPDILILNTPFGALDEYDILRALRIDVRLRGTSVMFLTPHKDHDSLVKGWKSGVDVYLTKPFNVAEVVGFVHRINSGIKAQEVRALAVEYAWRRQTEPALRCLAQATDLDPGGVAAAIRSEAAFHYLRQSPEFAAILAKLPAEAVTAQTGESG